MDKPKRRHVRTAETTHRVLRELAAETGEPMSAIVERAIERERREHFFTRMNAAWAALQEDPVAHAAIAAEDAAWDATLADGLVPEEW